MIVLDIATCERARIERDVQYDGLFFFGVRTTGVYCRPICTARRAHRTNVTYFASAAEAETAGFRPCRRCHPDAAPTSPRWRGVDAVIGRARRLIEAGALDRGSLADLAERLGVTERHLRRLFVARLKTTPHSLAAARRIERARSLLRTDLPLSEIAHESGFRSLRAFNAAFRRHFHCAPSAWRVGAV